MTAPTVLIHGLGIGESPRWRSGRLWLSNWGTQEIITIDLTGTLEVAVRVPTSIPFCFDWLPDGRLLVVSGPEARLLTQEADGALAPYADLSPLAGGWNEIVVDGRGNAYVNGGDYDFGAEPFVPGVIALVTHDGAVRQVADDIAFGNGMAVTPDNHTLIVAESFANRLSAFDIGPDGNLANRRVWAELGDGAPDGICLDAEGAIWYADVPNRCCVRVAEGGEVLQQVALDRGGFACMLGGADGRTLFILAAEWQGPEQMLELIAARTGLVLAAPAPAPAAGWP